MSETSGNTSLFPVFVLTILSIVLFPWTVYKFCCASSADSTKLWETADNKKRLFARFRTMLSASNVAAVLLWLLWVFLVVHVSQTQKDMTPFDPFAILEVEPGATAGEIKKAYFQKSLRYHPDKSSDPEDHKYFAEFVSKAYQALTDPASKENYEKYGHPDGQQSMDLGIALPEWLFTKDPRVLLVLVLVFVLLPLSTMAWYLFRSDQYTGPNSIMQNTIWNFASPKIGIKESQGIGRIPETLVWAREFTQLYTPQEHVQACDELRKLTLSFYPELKEKPQFWKRRASMIKVHMLLYAHLERAHGDVPPVLSADLDFVLQKSVPLLQEMFKVACLPRRPYGHGWLTPAISIIQCMQCVTQAVPLSVRRMQLTKRVNNEGYAALLQLRGMNGQTAKNLGKKRIKAIQDVLSMAESERTKLLRSLGFDAPMLQDVDTALQAMPTIDMTTEIFVEGEEEIQQGDIITCKVRLVLTRPSHASGEVTESDVTSGSGVLCFSPYYPAPRPEKWYIVVSLPTENRLICFKHLVLKEAEVAGLQRATRNEDEELGQVVELQFPALFDGTTELQVGCYSDCWIGSDKTVTHKIQVKKAARMRQATKPTAEDSEDEEEGEETQTKKEEAAAEEEGSEDEESGRDEVDSDEYDSEETGELETGSDEEQE